MDSALIDKNGRQSRPRYAVTDTRLELALEKLAVIRDRRMLIARDHRPAVVVASLPRVVLNNRPALNDAGRLRTLLGRKLGGDVCV